MTCPVVCLAVTLVAFSSPDHGWRRSSPDLLRAEQTADGLAIDFSGKDPNMTGPSYVFPVPKKAGSRAMFTLETSPSEDVDEYQLFYAFGKAPFAEHEKLILRPVDGKPPYSRYRAELAAPDYTPGANVSLRLDPPPGEKRKAVLKSLDLSFREPIWTPAFSVPSPFACVGERHVLEGAGWRLVQDGARWDAWALEAEDSRVAESPCEEPVAYLDGKGVVRTLDWAQSPCHVRCGEGWLEATTASKDADGTTWTISRRFSVASEGALDVRTHVAIDRPVRLVHFPYLTVLADHASGGRKTQALLPGVEYLADEPSSNEMELRGRDARRTMPEAWKVCFPLMLLVRASGEKARRLSLAWNRENGACQAASAVFDTPDRQFRSGGHLFALWTPAVESGREANDPAAYEAQPFTGGTVTARLALGGERSVGEALGRLVTGSDLPRPQEVPMSAFVDRVAPGWLGTHLGEGGKWGRPRRVVADVASTLEWLAAHATGSGQRSAFNARLCETMAAFPSNGTERLGWGAQLYRWSSPSGPFLRRSVRRLQREQEGHLARMVKAWSKGYLQYRPSPGKPDYAAGWEAKDANGHSATFMMALMRTAAWSGNEARIAEAVDIVRRMRDRYAGTVPRGAQSWEMPLHTPDIMASAFMADTLALAYQLSGDKTLLESAREWAQTGLAFVYLEEPRAAHPKSVLDPYGLYATTAVLGASEWTLTNWIGRPVQWCGMAYALALLDLANVETDSIKAGFWRKVAAGIAYSGLKQCYTDADPPYNGLLPDSFEPPSQRRHLGALSTRTLVEAIGELRDEPIYRLVRPCPDKPFLVHAPAAVSVLPAEGDMLRMNVAAWPEKPFQMLVTRIDRPARVMFAGKDVAFTWESRTLVIDLPARAHGILQVVARDVHDSPRANSWHVARFNGVPRLAHGGRPVPERLYFGNPMDHDTVRLALAAGVEIFQICDYWLDWEGAPPGHLKNFDDRLDSLLAIDPRVKVLPRLHFDDIVPEILKKHPEYRIWRENGTFMTGYNVRMIIGNIGCPEFRAAMLGALRRTIRHLEAKYGDRIVGYHPAYGAGGEWQYWECRGGTWGFDPGMRGAFRRFLSARYKTDSSLAAAWNDPAVTLATADIPRNAERAAAASGFLYEPQTAQRFIDYHLFLSDLMTDALLDCARVVREEAPDKLSCFFYGYSFENSKVYEGSPAATGSFALRKVLSSPDVDVLCGPFGYPPETRALGGGTACHAPAESVLLAGKIWLNEDDNGTHVTAADIAATGRWSPDGAVHARRTVDEAERILARDMAFCHLRNSAFWWMDLFGRKWHADKRLWDEMGRWRPLENAAMTSNSLLKPDVAVTVHEPSSAYLVHSSVPRGLCEWLANRNRDRISRAGVVYGQYLLDDVMAGHVPDAKLDIHALAFALGGDERRTLALRAQRTATLWLALPGLIDLDAGLLSTNAVRELTGFDVCFVTPASFAVRATGDGLAYGLPAAFGQCEASAPLLGVNPMPGDVVLARWMDNPQHQGDGTPAVVYRPAANGHAAAFFSGTNELPQELVRLAARLAGAHVWCDDDLHVQANGRLAAFTAPKAGIYVIRTPSGPVRDVLTGKLLAEGSCLTRRFAKGETLAVSF